MSASPSSPDLDDDTMRVDQPTWTPDTRPSAPVGASLGRYLVIGELGRGGMGVVLRAYDPKLQREVALKHIHAGANGDDQAVLVHEARAMAQLSHANVVSVYDVELEDGAVVLAMECVDGTNLVEWLSHPRSWREVIALFLAAGNGLQAAHTAGLLHRDFKPSNVLVSADGRAKVTDFGLAGIDAGYSMPSDSGEQIRPRYGTLSSVEQRSEVTDITSIYGNVSAAQTAQGTPAYMAPEQHRGESLTAAADQYAFCVSLWQALCGSVPFPTKGMPPARLRLLKEAGPPPWPREVDLPRALVDAIVRGLHPDASERWPTMAELLATLGADPHRRRRALAWSAVAVCVVAGSIAATTAWMRAQARVCQGAAAQLVGVWDDDRRAAAEQAVLATGLAHAPETWSRVASATDRYAAQWIAAYTEACEATSVRAEQSAQVMDLRMNCLRRAKLQLAASSAALVAADRATVDKAHALIAALPELGVCDDIEALQSETVALDSEVERERVRAVEATLADVRTQVEIGNFAQARTALESIEAEVASLDHAPTRGTWSLESGMVAVGLGEYASGEVVLADALRIALGTRQLRLASVAAQQLSFVIGIKLGRYAEGLVHAQIALGLAAGLGAMVEAHSLNSLAGIHNGRGESVQAEAELRRAVALHDTIDPESVAAANVLDNLAVVLLMQDKLDEAEIPLRQALAIYERELGPLHPDLIGSRSNLSGLLHARGAFAEAELETRAVIELYESAFGAEHPDVARMRVNLGVTLNRLGRHAEAETEIRAALAIFARTLAGDHVHVAAGYEALGTAQAGAGKLREAEASFRRSLAMWERLAVGGDEAVMLSALDGLAAVLREDGRGVEAAQLLERAQRIEAHEGQLSP
jgi:eukaryotic-like serine/threonine-protein kinase